MNVIQEQVATTKQATEDAILDAINAIKLASEGATVTADAKLLDQARALHRKAQFMWDFVSAENSTGFHNPEYALADPGGVHQLRAAGADAGGAIHRRHELAEDRHVLP